MANNARKLFSALTLRIGSVKIAAMNLPNGMFQRAWITAGHGDLWNCNATYCVVPYEYLPQLDNEMHDFTWLDSVSPELRKVIDSTSTLNSSDNQIQNLASIEARARSLGLSLPQPFVSFMRDTRLQDKVPTCTGCFLALSEDFMPAFGADRYFLLRFLNDSQSCVMWYLCLGQDGSGGVVASNYFFEPDIFELMEYEEVKRQELLKKAILCADTFTEFLYRFWVENAIWYSQRESLPLRGNLESYRNQIVKKL